MSNVKDLAEFIHSLGPERDIARLTFYNYLINCTDKSQPVNSELIFDYLCFTQNYEHWRRNAGQLLSGLKEAVERFQRTHPVNISLEADLDPQFIHVNKMPELSLFISKYFKNSNSDNLKVVPFNASSIALLDFSDSGLEVKVFNNSLVFKDGELHPTTPVSRLHYSQSLALRPHVQQTLQLTPTSYCSFVLNSEGSHGSGWMFRGYSNQKHTQLSFQRLQDAPELYQALKRLEYLYINCQTDPDYVHLVKLIEQSCASIQSDDPGCEGLANTAIEKTKLALENYYPNDRYLSLLLSQLELAIIKRYQNPAHALEI